MSNRNKKVYKQYHVLIEHELDQKVRSFVYDHELDRSELVRTALVFYINSFNKDSK